LCVWKKATDPVVSLLRGCTERQKMIYTFVQFTYNSTMNSGTMSVRKILQTAAAVAILFLVSTLLGCATFRIPPPKTPPEPLVTQPAERSIITVPIVVSMTALTDKLNLLLSRSRALNTLNQENNISGKLQNFLNGRPAVPDDELLNNIYLRMAVARAWDALQNPIRLNYDLSLLLNLQEVLVARPVRKRDTSTVLVGLVAMPSLVSGNMQKSSSQPAPKFSRTQELSRDGFHIAINNELSFNFIGEELTRNTAGVLYHSNGKRFRIDRIRIYASGDSAVLEIKITGAASGTLYLSGTPAYDASAETLFLQNLDYTFETKNILARTTDWLLHSDLQATLSDQAKWFIGDKIAMVKDRLTEALNRKVNQYVSITGKVQRVRLEAVGVTNNSLKAVFRADGTAEISVF